MEQRRGRVPRVVQPEPARQCLGPEEHLALRAAAALAVGVLLLVRRAVALATPTAVQVALDDAGAAERAPQALAELVGLRPHLAVRPRKEQRAFGRIESFFEVRHQCRRDRHRLLASALVRLVAVRAAYREQSPLQIDVALLQSE